MALGMQQVKQAALADVDAFGAGRGEAGALSYHAWIAVRGADYQEWLTRLLPR
jgi:hypothetical protein